MVDLFEILADAHMKQEGWFVTSRSWRNRNPGNLRPYQQGQPQDADGYRTFRSLVDGYEALMMDLRAKYIGLSHGLTSESTIHNVCEIYAPTGDNNDPSTYSKEVAAFCATALQQPVTWQTTIKELLEYGKILVDVGSGGGTGNGPAVEGGGS